MAVNREKVRITKGATFAHVFTWVDESQDPVDVTGYTAEFVAKDRAGSEVVSVTSSSGIALGGTAGTATVTLTPVQTDLFVWATDHAGSFSLVLTSSGGAVVPLAAGVVEVVEVAGL